MRFLKPRNHISRDDFARMHVIARLNDKDSEQVELRVIEALVAGMAEAV